MTRNVNHCKHIVVGKLMLKEKKKTKINIVREFQYFQYSKHVYSNRFFADGSFKEFK